MSNRKMSSNRWGMSSPCRVLTALFAALALAAAPAVHAGGDPYLKVSNGIAAYLGVMPSSIVRGHAPAHPESTMHGGPSRSASERHIVVALFDAKTSKRITEAEVTASVQGLGHVAFTRKKLERMDIADAPTFGQYFSFPGPDTYTIEITVVAVGYPKGATMKFTYKI